MSRPPAKAVILVVEDESLLRMMAVDMFEEAGFHVLEATTGERALGLIDGGQAISGLFTDVELGGDLDGCALARITHDRHPDAAILVVSGRRNPSGTDLPPGAIFVGKPYDRGQVQRTLTQMLGEDSKAD